MKHVTALAACLAATPAAAHIVFADPAADAGSYYAGFLRVSHGCGAAGTGANRVEIPPAIVTVRPQPKPGWSLAIEHAPLATPVPGEGGTQITQRVTAITWTGNLPADQFDQFGLMMKLRDAAGPLFFPTRQRCSSGENDWVDIPASPETWHMARMPAPMLVVRPAMAGHAMH